VFFKFFTAASSLALQTHFKLHNGTLNRSLQITQLSEIVHYYCVILFGKLNVETIKKHSSVNYGSWLNIIVFIPLVLFYLKI